MRFPRALLIAVAILAIGIVPLSASAKGTTYETTVTIKGPDGDFSGRVKSFNPQCETQRTVKVFKKREGKDKKIGTDTTPVANNSWSTGNSGYKKGKFYAKAPAVEVCEKGRSETITLG